MTKLDSILKSRDTTLPAKVHLVRDMVFPVVMYGCESWTIKKAEHQRTDAFELLCWRILLRVLWTVRRSNQSINPKGNQPQIFTGKTDAKAETPILWSPDGKNWLIGKDPNAGKDWRKEEKGMTEDEVVGWHHWFGGHEFEQTPGVDDGTGKPGVLQSMGSQRVGHDWVTELNWPENALLKSRTACWGDVIHC